MNRFAPSRRCEVRRAGALAVAVLVAFAVPVGCDGEEDADDPAPETVSRTAEDRPTRPQGITEEYRVARTIEGFLTALFEGDGEAACRRLSPEQQAGVKRRLRRPSCQRAIRLQAISLDEADLERLRRANVSRVALDGPRGTAEVVTPGNGGVPQSQIVEVEQIGGEWKLGSDFSPGALRSGVVPHAPAPPPPNPVEERKVAAVFTRFRRALDRGDGALACGLRTAAARREAVAQAIVGAGGRREAKRDYGNLTCAAVSANLRVPRARVRLIRVTSGRARLALTNGAAYEFRKRGGRWLVDS